jgi:hypothetical protein
MLRKHNLLSVVRAGLDWIVCSPWRSFIVIFLLSVATHVNQLNQIPSGQLIPSAYRELGAIAISLMQTGQFANTYLIPTGPTAHLPPMIPFIISMIYRWFGLTSTTGITSNSSGNIPYHLLYCGLHAPVQVPIDWILFILAGAAVWSWIGEDNSGWIVWDVPAA